MKTTVFVIEDDQGLRSALGMLLEEQGLRAVLFGRPQALLETLRSAAALPRLIVLELHLPTKNGDELVVLLQTHPLWRRIPLVIFTGWHRTPAFAVPVVLKPDIGRLLETIHAVLRRSNVPPSTRIGTCLSDAREGSGPLLLDAGPG